MKISAPITLALTASVLLIPACATVTRGPNVDFQVWSEPAGASVITTLKTSDTRSKERRQEKFIKYGVVNEDEVTPIEVEYRGCEATPCAFSVARRSEFITTVTLPGYHPATVEVTSGFGKEGASTTAGGTTASVAGGYVVTQAAVKLATSGFVAIAGAYGAGSTAASAAGSAAASAAASAATGIGVTMIGVDVLSGAMLNLQPNPLMVVLVPESEPAPEGDEAIIDTPEKYDDLIASQSSTEKSGT